MTENEWSNETAWEDVLPQQRRAPKAGLAEALVTRLHFAPPLEQVRALQKDLKPIQGLPETVPPRRTYKDRQIFTVQQKQEQALTLLVETVEATAVNHPSFLTAAALIRSAWEDLHEIRRRDLVGNQAHKLEKREDSSQLRLLSEGEEKTISLRKGKGKGKGSGQGQSFNNKFIQSQNSGIRNRNWTSSSNWQGHRPQPEQSWSSPSAVSASGSHGKWKGGGGKGRSRSASSHSKSAQS
jgi:hypothetical protein